MSMLKNLTWYANKSIKDGKFFLISTFFRIPSMDNFDPSRSGGSEIEPLSARIDIPEKTSPKIFPKFY